MADPRLSPRQHEILALLAIEGVQHIDALARRYKLTTQSIRRDINALCELGFARRLHGGVGLPVLPQNSPVKARSQLQTAAKRQIAARIAAEIPDGSTVFLGIGTTVQFTAEALSRHSGLRVVTNNIDVAVALGAGGGVELHVTGGLWRPNDRDVIGFEAIRFIEKFHATHSVVGAGGLHPTRGALDFSYEDAQITNAMIENSRIRYLAADATKWMSGAAVHVAPFASFSHFVTDRLPEDSAVASQLEASGISILTAV
jgi:DeoR family glycerol-3-phosphate regulon repressor